MGRNVCATREGTHAGLVATPAQVRYRVGVALIEEPP